MPAILASAPGKIILFGEHAVVYDRPAIAIPVNQVKASVSVLANPGSSKAGQIWIDAPAIDLHSDLSQLPNDHPLTLAIQGVQTELGLDRLPSVNIRISSSIPVAAGLGSGAAVSAALIRALAGFLGTHLPDERVSALTFRVEQLLHGTPSGIDNTVVTYGQPIFYQRSKGFERLQIGAPFTFVIADTGLKSPTSDVVKDVRQHWQQDPRNNEVLFDAIAAIVLEARLAIEKGGDQTLGELMTGNHQYLQQLGVSCPELDHLVRKAQQAGAMGAKLSGGGRGGNMIALTQFDQADSMASALQTAGAVRTWITHLRPDAKKENS